MEQTSDCRVSAQDAAMGFGCVGFGYTIADSKRWKAPRFDGKLLGGFATTHRGRQWDRELSFRKLSLK
jgi:hypothetical protein